ncbi:MAG: zinc finger MYND domain-containing protein, partial [Gammaproteobacteria bacterium]|nr:zinc finger MYND domain-containing protein [Gammaproteobacteria bacterium]
KPLPIPGGNIIPLTKPDGSQIIIIGINSEILWQAAQATNPSLPPLDTYWSSFGWHRDNNLFFIPQSSYHIDFDIAAPKPGVVIVNTYEKILSESGILNSLFLLAKTLYPDDSENIVEISLIEEIFRKQQRCLDEVANFFEHQGFRVIRVLGNLGFPVHNDYPSALEQGLRSAKIDGLSMFNFINGITKHNPDGRCEFVGFGAHSELSQFQQAFREALAKENIACRFLNEDDTTDISASVLENLSAGLRCLTVVASKIGVNATAPLPISPKQLCAGCGKNASLRCGGCHTVSYCSKDCQTAHWPTHRLSCKAKPT